MEVGEEGEEGEEVGKEAWEGDEAAEAEAWEVRAVCAVLHARWLMRAVFHARLSGRTKGGMSLTGKECYH
jgi:hypothetical protein